MYSHPVLLNISTELSPELDELVGSPLQCILHVLVQSSMAAPRAPKFQSPLVALAGASFHPLPAPPSLGFCGEQVLANIAEDGLGAAEVIPGTLPAASVEARVGIAVGAQGGTEAPSAGTAEQIAAVQPVALGSVPGEGTEGSGTHGSCAVVAQPGPRRGRPGRGYIAGGS